MRSARTTLGLVLPLALATPAAAEVALTDPSPGAQRVQSTLQQMRERREAADAERGGNIVDLKQKWDAQKAAEEAAAAQRAQQSASKRRRRGGFFVFQIFRGVLQAGKEIAQAARDLKDHVHRQVVRHTGPVGKILEGAEKVEGWVVRQVKKPLRPVFDRTGFLGEILEVAVDVKAGDYVHGRIHDTKVGEAIERLRRGQQRVDDRFVEWTDRIDHVDSQLADAEALIDFLSGIKNPRAREALEGYIEERLGVPLGDIVIGEGGRGTTRDNVRTGVQGAHRPGGAPPGMPSGGMEGRGAPPTPPRGHIEGTGRGHMPRPPR